MVGYLNKFLLFLILLTGIYSCKTSKNISSNCQNDKIKFELLETGQLIGYEFCIPDNETVWNEVIAINPQLKKTKSKGQDPETPVVHPGQCHIRRTHHHR